MNQRADIVRWPRRCSTKVLTAVVDEERRSMNSELQVFTKARGTKGHGRACILGVRKGSSEAMALEAWLAERIDVVRFEQRHRYWRVLCRLRRRNRSSRPIHPQSARQDPHPQSPHSRAVRCHTGALAERTCSSPGDRHRRTRARHADDARQRTARSAKYQAHSRRPDHAGDLRPGKSKREIHCRRRC